MKSVAKRTATPNGTQSLCVIEKSTRLTPKVFLEILIIMKERYPQIFHRIIKSELVSRAKLEQVYQSLYNEIIVRNSYNDSSSSENKSLAPGEDDFELNQNYSYDISYINNEVFDDASSQMKRCHFENEMEELLPRRLQQLGLINQWQTDQLAQSRIRFTLGKYRIIDFIGLGGYGQVFLGRSKTDSNNNGLSEMKSKHKSDVAIKVLPLSRTNSDTVARFLQEIQFVGQLNHPNIVQLIDYSKEANVYYAVYEYLDAGDVRKLIERNEQLTPIMAIYIVSEVSKALQYLHEKRGIIHRDIKPGNILLSNKGKVKLIDFGLSTYLNQSALSSKNNFNDPFNQSVFNENSFEYNYKKVFSESFENENNIIKKELSDSQCFFLEKESETDLEEKKTTRVKKVVGTPDYLSPDQIRNPQSPSPLWDIYSLGCSFYYMVTGIVPFPSGDSLQKIQAQLRSDPPEPKMFNQALPQDISNLIMQMMAKKKEDRVQTAAEVIQRLSPWVPQFDEANSIIVEMLNDSNFDFWTPDLFNQLTHSPINILSQKRKKTFKLVSETLNKSDSRLVNHSLNLIGHFASMTSENPNKNSEIFVNIPPVFDKENSLESNVQPFHEDDDSDSLLLQEENGMHFLIVGTLILIILILIILILYFLFSY
ncbi:MAG: serine/threonine-protein kinase [Planctomycetia bacterium]|nr:serine/threonine-protein kinase [Planctomycetia bacterium]